MEKCGMVAVGHVLENKSPDAYLQAMRHFCTIMFCNMDEKLIYKSSGYWRFDQFFSSVEVSVESFGKFVAGILRRPDADLAQLQLQIERIAWDFVKCDFDGFSGGGLDGASRFRLFCLFNRFCRRDSIPLRLHRRAAVFLCKELGLPTTLDPEPSFRGLLKHAAVFSNSVHRGNNGALTKAVKRMYDEFVRDVIKEGKVQFRVKDDTFGSIVNGSRTKTHAVTSRHLIIYEDTDVYEDDACTGKVIHMIPLIAVGVRPSNGLFGRSKMYLELVSKNRAYPSIEMAFAANKDSFDLFSWNQAIQEAVHRTRTNATGLTKAYSKLGIGESPPASRVLKQRHSSASINASTTEAGVQATFDESGEQQPRERFYSLGNILAITKPKNSPPPPRKTRPEDGGGVSPLLRRTLLRVPGNDGSLVVKQRNDTVVANGKIGDSNTSPSSRRP